MGSITKNNNIYVMNDKQQELKPYVILGKYASEPLLSTDGKRLFFQADGIPETGGGWTQYYLYAADGRHQRLTDLNATTVWSGAVSADGEQLALTYDIAPQLKIRKIMLYNLKDGSHREIKLPDSPSRIIEASP